MRYNAPISKQLIVQIILKLRHDASYGLTLLQLASYGFDPLHIALFCLLLPHSAHDTSCRDHLISPEKKCEKIFRASDLEYIFGPCEGGISPR
jgi:hypothetical protein